MLTGALPVHLNFTPPLDTDTEIQVSELWVQAGRIVSRMETPQSTVTSLLQRLKEKSSNLEKDEVREELKKEISSALVAGGISRKLIDKMVLVFVNLMMMGGIALVHAETGSSIILYLKCGSVEILLNLREMVLSGLLLQLLSDVIKVFIRSQVQMVMNEEDYNLSLFYLNTVAGNSSGLKLRDLGQILQSLGYFVPLRVWVYPPADLWGRSRHGPFMVLGGCGTEIMTNRWIIHFSLASLAIRLCIMRITVIRC